MSHLYTFQHPPLSLFGLKPNSSLVRRPPLAVSHKLYQCKVKDNDLFTSLVDSVLGYKQVICVY